MQNQTAYLDWINLNHLYAGIGSVKQSVTVQESSKNKWDRHVLGALYYTRTFSTCNPI